MFKYGDDVIFTSDDEPLIIYEGVIVDATTHNDWLCYIRHTDNYVELVDIQCILGHV